MMDGFVAEQDDPHRLIRALRISQSPPLCDGFCVCLGPKEVSILNPALDPDLTYALAEEIGDPELFVGREEEIRRLLDWADGVKRRINKSMAILARRKKGKTAILQRFYNILYTRNDPQLIPFYYRIQEERLTKTLFAESFYRRVLSQYFAFTTRRPELVRQALSLDELKELAQSDSVVADDIRRMEDILARFPGQSWEHARDAGHRIASLKDIRIIQILDEFQYLNRYIHSDDVDRHEDLCHSYMGTAESKFSPQIVAGSYIGWLTAILGHMTARYRKWYLDGLTDEDALAAAYNYARIYRVAITDDAAAHAAEICDKDAFYIAATISNHPELKDLTTEEGIRLALALETDLEHGEIASVWFGYIWDAFDRVNDVNARKIVLYLAAHEPEERDRDQIREDLQLDMTDPELEKKLHKLVKADILANGSSNFRYRGLGDRVFAMVFRRLYSEEIERMGKPRLEADFLDDLKSLRGKLSRAKGIAAEYKVRYRLLLASYAEMPLGEIVTDASRTLLPSEDLKLGPLKSLNKESFHLDQEHRVEVDLFAPSEKEDVPDLIVEVKDWRRPLNDVAARAFIESKEKLRHHLKRPTIFMVYSENGLGEAAKELLEQAEVLILDPAKLGRCKFPSTL